MISMVELGKLILQHRSDVSITILVPSMPLEESKTCSYINSISHRLNPIISFYYLPTIQMPSETLSRADIAIESIKLNSSNVFQALENISLTSKILSFIITSTTSFSYHPNIPTYTYFNSCASTLAAILYLPTLHNQITSSFKDHPSSLLFIPGLPPVKSSFMPEPVLDRQKPIYDFFLNYSTSLSKSTGIIINTFDFLEQQAIKAIVHGACVTNGTTPPLHCIGPLIVDAKDRAGGVSDDVSSDCLTWLDSQPSGSVVFLCFGSRGTFSAPQLKEIAIGLERCNQRFLWVVRNPSNAAEAELPEGFLERTKERGLVVKSWAPQSTILGHESVGGFVTHCGWSSVVEAVTYGVPMIAWPLYAEQFLNSVALVQEMKVAMPMFLNGEEETIGNGEGVVSAERVEERVRELMMGSEGKALRERSLEMRMMAATAWNNNDGGSSFTAFSNLVASWNSLYS
ncbi:UDP-glycosyltransferase 88A1 [Citrus sinensis]|nr:UDP-glycosyltransferase 88A1 [Citrus sinensis]